MSSVFIHLGQCGNQVSQHLWECIEKDGEVIKSRSFITHDGYHRAVHVDSEPKVTKHFSSMMKIRKKNVISGKRGYGNNWALGYHGLQGSGNDSLLEDTLESIRRETERCDMLSGFLLTHSLSGGTGSGFGSRLCEALREEYPVNYLLSVTCAPCASGESPLQHFNSVLCLATLQRMVDGVILIQNDAILNRLQNRSSDKQVSFDAINRVIGHTIAGCILPTNSLATTRDISLGQEPWDLVRACCPMPATKFMQSIHLAGSKLSWGELVTQAFYAVPRYDGMGHSFSSLAGIIAARGDTSDSFCKSWKLGLDKKVISTWNFVDWNPFPVAIWTAFLNTTGPKDAASITMAVNSSCVTQYLHTVHERSEVMLKAGAYLHWYEKYGILKDDIEEAMRVVHMCQDDYAEAVKYGCC